jgi:3-hydroxyacyl-[acyl-carrier-protein] dehydratase
VRFLLVDDILELEPGKRIRGLKRIATDEDYFRDHFPGFPVVPGVLLTEMMAQLAGKCLDAENPARGRSMLAAIESAKFRHWVNPGEIAMIEAIILVSRPQFAKAKCQVHVGEKLVATSELFFSFVAGSQFAPGFRDPVLERYYESQPGPSGKTS